MRRTRTRSAGGLFAALLLTMGITISLGAGTAAADDPVETFRNSATNACLDDSIAGLRTFPCNGLDFQQWWVHKQADGSVQLKNVNTHQCVYALGTQEAVLKGSCSNSSPQDHWHVYHWQDGGLAFINNWSHLCLDDSFDHHLRQFPCENFSAGQESPYQTWY